MRCMSWAIDGEEIGFMDFSGGRNDYEGCVPDT